MNSVQRLWTLCLFIGILGTGAFLFAEGNKHLPLKAGAAAIDITPPLGETVVGGFRPFPRDSNS